MSADFPTCFVVVGLDTVKYLRLLPPRRTKNLLRHQMTHLFRDKP